MKKFFLAIFCLALILALNGCVQGSFVIKNQPLKFAATFFPHYDILRNIVGDKAEVLDILPPNADPHTFELTPTQVKELQGTKVIFKIGSGIDDYIDVIKDSIPGVTLKTVDNGINILSSTDPEDKGINPHYWLSVANAKIIAQNITDEVSMIDPQNKEYYQNNAQMYIGKLDNLEMEVNKQLKDLSSRDLISFHNAWPYFAKEFNLNILASFEPFPGKEPTAQYLKNLGNQIKKYEVKVIFAEKQFSTQSIAAFAQDSGLKIYTLNTMESGTDKDSFIGIMEQNAKIINQALK